MRLIITTHLILISLFTFNAQANMKKEQTQKQIASNLRNMSTDELIWIRAFNNQYSANCKNHHTSKVFNIFSEVATEVVVSEMIDRDDWGIVMNTKYGYRKGQLKALKKRIGRDSYCTCIYNHIIKGKSECLNP